MCALWMRILCEALRALQQYHYTLCLFSAFNDLKEYLSVLFTLIKYGTRFNLYEK